MHLDPPRDRARRSWWPTSIAAVGERIDERVVLGDPRAEGVTMGALASLEQLADVRAAVQSMLDAGGELAYGTLDSPQVTSADGTIGVVDGGAFMSPVLLSWADPEAEAVHSLEAFGPVVLGDRLHGPGRRRPPRRPRRRLAGGHGLHQRSRRGPASWSPASPPTTAAC